MQSEEIDQAFVAALLLTGSMMQAEEAVVRAIERWDSDDALLTGAIREALRVREEEWGDHDVVVLPEELRRVRGLSPAVRDCYVLRILGGLTRQISAALLRISVGQVDLYTLLALNQLPGATGSDERRRRNHHDDRLRFAARAS